MAMSDLEKSVQNIKDPAKRKAAYYTAQRIQAEDNDPLGKTATTINKKLGPKGRERALEMDASAPITASDVMNAATFIAPEIRLASGIKFGSGIKKAGKVGQALESTAVKVGSKAAKALGSVKDDIAGLFTKANKQKALPAAKTMKNVTGSARTALGSSAKKDAGEFDAELRKMQKKGASSKPKTFNRDGSKKSEVGRKKSDRNPKRKAS